MRSVRCAKRSSRVRTVRAGAWSRPPMTMAVSRVGRDHGKAGAAQDLLAEINPGLIDVMVVYKVDRLTRSLADFAKMVEVFDACGVSFVAVTQ
jgi:hypothetical protein